MRKLKICLCSLAAPPDRQDGEAKFFGGIFEYLKKKHDVTLITGKWNIEIQDEYVIQFNLIRKRFFWVPHFNLKAIQYLKKQEFDIIHGNGPKGSLPIVLSGKEHFISTIHDLGPFETPFTRIPLQKYLIKYIAKKASLITTCTEFIRRELKYYLPKIDINKIYNLYSAIEEKYHPYSKEAQELKESLRIEGPIMLYIGRIATYKGVEDIIAAYRIAKKSIPNLNLLLGGNPDFSMQKKYQEWKQKFKDIHFLGFIPSEKIAHYYSMADVFVTYSFASEGFGLTPVEAIACGAPVICSSMLAYKEVLQDNAIFIPPKEPQKLAQEVVNLLKNEDLKKNLIKKAQNFIKRYTWDSVGQRLEKVYEKFVIDK